MGWRDRKKKTIQLVKPECGGVGSVENGRRVRRRFFSQRVGAYLNVDIAASRRRTVRHLRQPLLCPQCNEGLFPASIPSPADSQPPSPEPQTTRYDLWMSESNKSKTFLDESDTGGEHTLDQSIFENRIDAAARIAGPGVAYFGI